MAGKKQRKTKNPLSESHITRRDFGAEKSFWVRVYRREFGVKVCHSKSFADKAHGSRAKALAAARVYREALLSVLPPKDKPGNTRVPVGHAKIWRRTLAPGRVVWIVRIKLTDDGKRGQTHYSVLRWGEAGAKKRAEMWLANKRAELGL
jgi:hypothetical protein